MSEYETGSAGAPSPQDESSGHGQHQPSVQPWYQSIPQAPRGPTAVDAGAAGAGAAGAGAAGAGAGAGAPVDHAALRAELMKPPRSVVWATTLMVVRAVLALLSCLVRRADADGIKARALHAHPTLTNPPRY